MILIFSPMFRKVATNNAFVYFASVRCYSELGSGSWIRRVLYNGNVKSGLWTNVTIGGIRMLGNYLQGIARISYSCTVMYYDVLLQIYLIINVVSLYVLYESLDFN